VARVSGSCIAGIQDPPVALTHLFFLVSVALITMVSQSTRRVLERREFEARAAQARLLAEVEALATTDALTGLWNRRQVLRLAQDAKLRSDRYGHPLSIVLLDIDRFKSVNDTWGHSVGDEVIAEVARRIQASLRATDFAGRYAGEEFLVVLPETEAEFAAEVVAERLRAAVASVRVRSAAGLLPVTISLGVARALPAAEPLGAAIDRADAALYAAKRGGRDQVALAPTPVVELAGGAAGADPPAAVEGA
jgi:diguanylate cyclase (GGDEF)-like protein